MPNCNPNINLNFMIQRQHPSPQVQNTMNNIPNMINQNAQQANLNNIPILNNPSFQLNPRPFYPNQNMNQLPGQGLMINNQNMNGSINQGMNSQSNTTVNSNSSNQGNSNRGEQYISKRPHQKTYRTVNSDKNILGEGMTSNKRDMFQSGRNNQYQHPNSNASNPSNSNMQNNMSGNTGNNQSDEWSGNTKGNQMNVNKQFMNKHNKNQKNVLIGNNGAGVVAKQQT